MVAVKSFLATVAFAAAAAAHFTVVYPDYRATGVPSDSDDGAGDQTQFCGGLPVQSKREAISISNGVVAINDAHDEGTVFLSLALADDPADFSAFNSSLSKTGITVLPFFDITGAGIHCFALPDLAKLDDRIKDGVNATLLFAVTGHSILYQCADVILSANATTPSKDDLKCASDIVAAPSGTDSSNPSNTNSGASTPTTSPSGAGFQVAATAIGVFAGLVAAGVALL
ncbi:hypothetical protein BKA62DRAFT_462805 [Auriculariales sp. MPI-PUGE-AT-0066]|nr:hypothetical protein BKA62DRAFT_462805 [Auriculariales sp. MPI-PUGE-AT-0066]